MREEKIPMKEIIGETNRQYGGEGDIRILAENMKANGLINPITVFYPLNDNVCGYNIAAGRRRYAAAMLLGWETIPARILENGEEKLAEAIAGSENINRLAMHPLDEAAVFRRLIEAGETPESLAKRYDRSKAAIWQRVQLLDLNEGIKELFRKGLLSLHAAAMLKSLDNEKQEKFYKEYKSYNFGIRDVDVRSFIASVNKDYLYKCVEDSGCKACEKRTHYSDKELFPELEGASYDLCLDHECYMQKWSSLMQGRIKSVQGEHKESHGDADIIATASNELLRVFGKGYGPDFAFNFKKIDYGFPTEEKASAGARPCFEAELENGKLKIQAKYWKTPFKKKKASGGNEFDKAFKPMAKLLDMPKEEEEQTLATVKKGIKRQEYWAARQEVDEYERKVRRRVLERLIKAKAAQPADGKDIERYCAEWLKDDKDNKLIAKTVTGVDTAKALRMIDTPFLFVMLYASQLRHIDLPDIEKIAKEKQNDIAAWAGVTMGELREMYKEELRALMPKPEAKGKPAKRKAKTTAVKQVKIPAGNKKPAVKKPVQKTAAAKAKSAAKVAELKKLAQAAAKPVLKTPVRKTYTTGMLKQRGASEIISKPKERKKLPDAQRIAAVRSANPAVAAADPSLEM